MSKQLTPEEIQVRKERSNEWHREWRKKNPEKQKAIMERFWAKKAAEAQQRYAADLENIQTELSGGN